MNVTRTSFASKSTMVNFHPNRERISATYPRRDATALAVIVNHGLI